MKRDRPGRHERMYRLLLLAYPASFRACYEREMLLVFRDQQREAVTRDLRYWMSLVGDTVRSAPREWKDELIANFQSGARPMKRMAIAAIVVATFELLNAGSELQSGGISGRDSLAQLTLSLVLLSTVLLLFAGITLMRRGQAAVPLARIAAVCCLASFAFIGHSAPVLSGLAMLAGLGFPALLLLYLFIGGRGQSATPA